MKVIPLSTDSVFSQVTSLGGQDFIMTFEWNARESAWYLDVADQDDIPIFTAVKVVVNWPLAARCVDPRRPRGVLIAIDSTGAGLDPLQDDLGKRVELFFIDDVADLA